MLLSPMSHEPYLPNITRSNPIFSRSYSLVFRRRTAQLGAAAFPARLPVNLGVENS